jgi:hypothetical protein
MSLSHAEIPEKVSGEVPGIDYSLPVSPEAVARTVDALRLRGFKVQVVDNAAQALAKVHEIIPAQATIMSAPSQTLQEIGLEAQLINKEHPWINLKDEILAEPDPVVQMQMRVKTTLAPWYLGSVQAIAQTGEIVVASGSGSQLPSYAFSSPNLLWVAGIQKIVPTLEDGIRRIREYSLPLEHIRMQALGYPGAMLSKILILEQESPRMGRNVNLILVNERVGA